MLRNSADLPTIVLMAVAPGSVNTALQPLRMAANLDRYWPGAGTLLVPCLV
jgi:hypothetical protein